MRFLDFLLPLSGLVLVGGAAYSGLKRKRDVVEVTAISLAGIAIVILGSDRITSVPAWLEWLAIVLMFVATALLVGNPRNKKGT